jgi:hypothetical protein
VEVIHAVFLCVSALSSAEHVAWGQSFLRVEIWLEFTRTKVSALRLLHWNQLQTIDHHRVSTFGNA